MRNQERAVPLAEIDATVPAGSAISSAAAGRDLDRRYTERRGNLAGFSGPGKATRPVMASIVMQAQKQPRGDPWNWIASGCDVAGVERFFSRDSGDAAPAVPAQVAGGRAGIINTVSPPFPRQIRSGHAVPRDWSQGALGYVADGLGRPSRRTFSVEGNTFCFVGRGPEESIPRMACRQIAQRWALT